MRTKLNINLDVATRLLCSDVINHPTMCHAERIALLHLALDLTAELIKEEERRGDGKRAQTHADPPKPQPSRAPPKPQPTTPNRYEELRRVLPITRPDDIDPAWGQRDAANDADRDDSDADRKAPPPRRKFP
ncbi:hypothetical protein [Lysobacter enzymogenes]|uniref:hypothetical protein n=1 Tax=Lysobacter enzymogenes TaxID=69 RepID=UPI000F4C1005|nr:hypothetical protein [Lysobacter enzymogenes]